MAPKNHLPHPQPQPFTPSSASTAYASPVPENGRLPSLTHPQNGGAAAAALSPTTSAASGPSYSTPVARQQTATPKSYGNGNGNGTHHQHPDESVDGNSASPDDGGDKGPARKKQKRNKPTLSCFECVERKTKVRSVHFSFYCPCFCHLYFMPCFSHSVFSSDLISHHCVLMPPH